MGSWGRGWGGGCSFSGVGFGVVILVLVCGVCFCFGFGFGFGGGWLLASLAVGCGAERSLSRLCRLSWVFYIRRGVTVFASGQMDWLQHTTSVVQWTQVNVV